MAFLTAALVGLAVLLAGWSRKTNTGPVFGGIELKGQGLQLRRAARRRQPPAWTRMIPPGLEAGIRGLRPMSSQGPDVLAQRLKYAGLSDVISAEQFICLRLMAPVGLFAALFLIYLTDPTPFRLVLAMAGGAVGVALPDHWLKQQVQHRQSAIKRELPSILTTLGVLLDSGLNLTPALQEITSRKKGILAGVLEDALRQTMLGTPIQEALQAGAQECGVQEFTLFVSVLSQALSKGAGGISAAVRAQAQQIWSLRQQQVQEKGQEMSQDLFLILLVLAFPAIALFLLGPVGLSLSKMFF